MGGGDGGPQFKFSTPITVLPQSEVQGRSYLGEATYAPQEERVAILCFGDSLTQGFSFSRGEIAPYSDRLIQRFKDKGVAVINKGVSGHTTSDMLERLPPLLEARQASASSSSSTKPFSLVLILGGTNDLNCSVGKEVAFRNLVALHRAVHRTNARTAVITLPFLRAPATQKKVDADRQWINASLREFAAQDPRSCLLIDLASAIPQDDAHAELWDADGVHFSPAGYRAMGELIGDALRTFDSTLGSKCP